MQVVLWLVLAVYCLEIARSWLAWRSIPEPDAAAQAPPSATAAIVVAMRNEASNVPQLLHALAAQTYPADLFEIVLVDDYSTDGTAAACLSGAATLGLKSVQVVELNALGQPGGKKAALAEGIKRTQARYFCTTDADCTMGPDWLRSMVALAEQKQAVLVSGPVCYAPVKGLLQKLQAVEFAGLIGVGAASIRRQQPTMCNGANLLVEKAAFGRVGGYSGNEHIASGDDEFLLHKLARAFPGRYHFLKSAGATVYTAPSATLAGLLSQRIRWASKWKHYQAGAPKWLALVVAAMQAAILAGVVLAFAGIVSWAGLLWVICVKFVFELLFFQQVLRFFGLLPWLWLVALLQVLYAPFVVVVALLSLAGKYSWKGRTVLRK